MAYKRRLVYWILARGYPHKQVSQVKVMEIAAKYSEDQLTRIYHAVSRKA